ncbi:DUF4405 domain-containing protein [Chloroflexota bacterium]
MKGNRPIKVKVYTRAVVAITLIVAWTLAAFTGLLLWLAPSGPRSGRQPLLLDLTKSEWGDIHFWVCVAVLIVTLVHIIIDWRALRVVIRYLTSAHRSPRIG